MIVAYTFDGDNRINESVDDTTSDFFVSHDGFIFSRIVIIQYHTVHPTRRLIDSFGDTKLWSRKQIDDVQDSPRSHCRFPSQ